MNRSNQTRNRNFRRWINEPGDTGKLRMALEMNNSRQKGPWPIRKRINDCQSYNHS